MTRAAPEHRVWLRRDTASEGWVETVEPIPWRVTRLRVSGRIASSLYDAIDAAVPDSVLPGIERVALAWALADVYDWEIDFTRDVRRGDRFDVLLDRLESVDGERRFGRIWAARVEVARTPAFAFYFEGDAEGAFYDEQGRSLRRAFLRTPLQFRRISSRFGGRVHPIRKEWRSHEGIDYAAAAGTPVRATAAGEVVRAHRHGGYGNLVEIRHVNDIHTRYGHLSRFATGIVPGARVSQDQTVGYVGSTGLSTGPHLHYEFVVNGRPTNPRRADAGAGEPVSADRRAAFDAVRAMLLAQLESAGSPVARRDD
jgi:murein DD-endopeptidase MepM/ murein hydrolase activator NlpD